MIPSALVAGPWRRFRRALGVALCGLLAASNPAWAASGASATAAPAVCPPAAVAADLSDPAIARAMEHAVDRGLLWRIEKDGRTSWLYGTLHVGRADWMVPGPRVRQALMQSDTVALELDLQDPATRAVLTAPPDAATAARVLNAERRRRLDLQVRMACLPAGALAGLQPILQVATLSMLAARAEGLYGDYGSEAFIAGFARARGQSIVGLETAADQLKILAGDSEAEEGEQIDEALDELESGEANRLTAELAQAWARSDWPRLDSYMQWCDCMRTPSDRRSMMRLLDDRNPGLADGIARLHAEGRRVFGAVGGLHMVGPQGLPALLAARGFRVTAVVPGPASP